MIFILIESSSISGPTSERGNRSDGVGEGAKKAKGSATSIVNINIIANFSPPHSAPFQCQFLKWILLLSSSSLKVFRVFIFALVEFDRSSRVSGRQRREKRVRWGGNDAGWPEHFSPAAVGRVVLRDKMHCWWSTLLVVSLVSINFRCWPFG